MAYRIFDKNKDRYYSPDATPSLYLSSEQVDEALSAIDHPGEDEIDVRQLITTIETLNRQEKQGTISAEECFKENRRLAEEFADKHGFYPHQTKTYEDFYNSFRRVLGSFIKEHC